MTVQWCIKKYRVQYITYHCTSDHNSPAVMIECRLIKSVSSCHYTEEDRLDRVYASSEAPITSRGNWILCWLQPFKWSFPPFFWTIPVENQIMQETGIGEFLKMCSLANKKTLCLLTPCFFPHSLINNSSSVFLIIRIKCWLFSTHYGFYLFVLLFIFFSMYIMKKVILEIDL